MHTIRHVRRQFISHVSQTIVTHSIIVYIKSLQEIIGLSALGEYSKTLGLRSGPSKLLLFGESRNLSRSR